MDKKYILLKTQTVFERFQEDIFFIHGGLTMAFSAGFLIVSPAALRSAPVS